MVFGVLLFAVIGAKLTAIILGVSISDGVGIGLTVTRAVPLFVAPFASVTVPSNVKVWLDVTVGTVTLKIELFSPVTAAVIPDTCFQDQS